ncbi:MAG: hypothetical protein Q9166_006477 [cf. Caloplaca sp. 2 TL-2023]
MDVHRCRFVPYPPSAINALAFSHCSSLTTSRKGPPTLRLAIGRANGDIEIWNPLHGAWHQESIFRGGKDRSIEGLVWTHDPEEQDKDGVDTPGRLRLFSIGYSSSVSEWDLNTGRPIRHASGNYGELWCIAAQPREHSEKKSNGNIVNGATEDTAQYQSLAVGCADGSIVLLSTADGDLKFEKTLTRPAKKKARVLSIAWQNKYTVITGHADSTIRIFDIRNGQQVRSMSLGAGPEGGPKEILVWSVKSLANGTIVSGDSTGTVSFWDKKNYSRLQRITSHRADILDLAVSVDGQSVFSGGMDRRTTLYRRTAGSRPGEKMRWVETAHQRFHSHDVKAMATVETKGISILASGGLDTAPIIIPIRKYGKEHHRTLSSLPQQPPVRSAPKRRLLITWWDREVSVWRISKSRKSAAANDELEDLAQYPAKKLVAKVLIQGEDSISSADVNDDGSLLVVSTLSEIKVFRLKDKHDSTVGLRKIDLPSELGKIGAKIIRWSPDSKWLLLVTSDNKTHLARIAASEVPRKTWEFLPQPVTLKRLPRKTAQPIYLHGSLGAYDRSVCRIAFSADSRILVICDLSGHLDTWVLEGHEDLTQDPPITIPVKHKPSTSSSSDESESETEDPETNAMLVYAQHWKRSPTAHLIPKLPSGPVIMSFRPAIASLTSSMALTNARHEVYEINVLTAKISDWSRRNPTSALPKDFRIIKDRAMGCIWDIALPSSSTTGRQKIWLYGSSWLWMFDLGQDLPKSEDDHVESDSDELQNQESAKLRKRKREMPSRSNGLNGSIDDDQKGDDASLRKRRRGRDTGAGSRIPTHELDTGVGRKMRKIEGAKGGNAKFVSLRQEVSSDESEEEEDDNGDEDEGALMRMRRGEKTIANGNGVEGMQQEKGPPFWGTFKYRPILGIVPLEGGGGENEDEDAVVSGDEVVNGDSSERRGRGKEVEVALVERPMFDVDLPGRFYGDQEWSERKDANVRL